MNTRILFLITLVLSLTVTNALAADHTAHGHHAHDHHGHASPADQDARIFTTTGVIQAIDEKHKTLSITHDAIPELGWPKMTMNFLLEDWALRDGISAGDKVRFDFRNTRGASVIVDMERR